MTPTHCAACGSAGGDHARSADSCAQALQLEPPRHCTECGRRMVVQVRPHGWHARCSRHGELDSVTTAGHR